VGSFACDESHAGPKARMGVDGSRPQSSGKTRRVLSGRRLNRASIYIRFRGETGGRDVQLSGLDCGKTGGHRTCGFWEEEKGKPKSPVVEFIVRSDEGPASYKVVCDMLTCICIPSWPAARLPWAIRVVPHVGNRTIFASSQTRKPPRGSFCGIKSSNILLEVLLDFVLDAFRASYGRASSDW
jgi:hypothetical protein